MAPDEDKLRRRVIINSIHSGTLHGNDENELITTKKTNELQQNEVAIDGVVYDLTSFNHPGGGSIMIFGGNDVTVTYKMIHPHHSSKNLEKMKKVGLLTDYKAEFKFDTPFEREIKQEVFKIVRRGREFGTPGYLFRVFLYVTFYFVSEALWVSKGSSITLAIILGLAQALIGLNVQHDANHGAASKGPWLNDILGFGADLIGGSKWTWMQQHWTHHSYTNHLSKDPDAISAEPMVLFTDYPKGHPARKFYHKFQVLFFFPILSFYWASSVFNPQILDLRQRGALAAGMQMENDFTIKRRKWAVLIRLIYIFVNVITPFLNHGLCWKALGHIWLMSTVESLTLAVLFALSHNFEHSDRDPTRSVRVTGEPVCWFKSQVETSSTYGGTFAGMLTGGLNFQVEHHLFPRMCSAWYPYIAPTVRRVCKKHGVRYAYYPWILQNLISTLKYMHQAGAGSSLENPYSGKA